MILTKRIAQAVASGEVTVAYRRWIAPRVERGSTFRTSAGVVRIETVEEISIDEISDTDARHAGYPSRDKLISSFRGTDHDPIFRIGLTWVGPDPRNSLAAECVLTPEDISRINALLDRLDRRTPWARATLERLECLPTMTAAKLCAELPIDKESLKRRIRTLKEHGLTRSVDAGYELSERGRAYMEARARHSREQ